jgi:hypothetical protein
LQPLNHHNHIISVDTIPTDAEDQTHQPIKHSGLASRLKIIEGWILLRIYPHRMVHTRAAANNRSANMVNAPTVKQTKAAAREAKKIQDAERARMKIIQKNCYDANRIREEASASAYIGQMKYIGTIDTINKAHVIPYCRNCTACFKLRATKGYEQEARH